MCLTGRGTQYRSNSYGSFLALHKIQRSMSRTDSCWDNAVMESFYARLEVELIYAKNFQSNDEARSGVFGYMRSFIIAREGTLQTMGLALSTLKNTQQ